MNLLSKSIYKRIELFEAEAWIDLYEAASPETKQNLGINIFSVGDSLAAVASKIDVIALNRIIGLGLREIITENNLVFLQNKLNELNVERFFVQLHPDTMPKNASSLLEKNSFCYYNNWVKLLRDNSPTKTVETDAAIKEIGKENADIFADILLKAFEWPDIMVPWITATAGRKNWKHYLAFIEGEAAGTGLTYIKNDLAWIAFASTAEEFRGRGIQTAMLGRRINDAVNAGAKYLIIETAENKPEKPSASYRNVVRSGFNPAYLKKNFLYKKME